MKKAIIFLMTFLFSYTAYSQELPSLSPCQQWYMKAVGELTQSFGEYVFSVDGRPSQEEKKKFSDAIKSLERQRQERLSSFAVVKLQQKSDSII